MRLGQGALSPSICLLSDTLLNEDALPHRSRREQGAGGHPVFSTGMVRGGRGGGGEGGVGVARDRCGFRLGVCV